MTWDDVRATIAWPTSFPFTSFRIFASAGAWLVLMILASPSHAEQISIKCEWGLLTISFDEEKGRVIVQAQDGPPHKGVIDLDTKDEIRFHYLPDQPNNAVGIWNRRSGVFAFRKSTDLQAANWTDCSRTEWQTIMSDYDSIWPQ